MLTNYDYKHDYLRIDRDLTLKLKEEEERAAYLNSENFNQFKNILKSDGSKSKSSINADLEFNVKSLSHLNSNSQS